MTTFACGLQNWLEAMHSLSVMYISRLRTSHLSSKLRLRLLFFWAFFCAHQWQQLRCWSLNGFVRGQTYPDQMNAGQSNAGLGTGEPTTVRGAGRVTTNRSLARIKTVRKYNIAPRFVRPLMKLSLLRSLDCHLRLSQKPSANSIFDLRDQTKRTIER